MSLICIYNVADAVFITNYAQPFPVNSLTATGSGDTVTLWTKDQVVILAMSYEGLARQDGSKFDSLNACLAYLNQQLNSSSVDGGNSGKLAVLDGQTVFAISPTPKNYSSARLIVNGVQYRAPQISINDYSITWSNGLFNLSSNDDVYYSYS